MANPFRYRYKAQVIIESKKELVWKALTDLDNYHLWNPFTPKVVTNWEIGDPVHLTVRMKKGKLILQKEYLSKFNANSEFAWGMSWGLWLKAERVQRLSDHGYGITMYFTEDVIKGALSPLVHLMYGKSIQNGFDALAKGLKAYLEK